MYLIHLSVLTLLHSNMKFEITFSHFTAVTMLLAAIGLNILIAAIIYVFVELPWLTLEKLTVGLLTGTVKRPKKTIEDQPTHQTT